MGTKCRSDLILLPELLVLDDIVRPKMKLAYVNAVQSVLHQRHQEKGKHTLVTSNLWPAEVAHSYDEATASRICGGLVVHLIGRDYRQIETKRRDGAA